MGFMLLVGLFAVKNGRGKRLEQDSHDDFTKINMNNQIEYPENNSGIYASCDMSLGSVII